MPAKRRKTWREKLADDKDLPKVRERWSAIWDAVLYSP